MIGIDTNILLRLWLDDDPSRNKHMHALLAEHGRDPGSLLVTGAPAVSAGIRQVGGNRGVSEFGYRCDQEKKLDCSPPRP